MAYSEQRQGQGQDTGPTFAAGAALRLCKDNSSLDSLLKVILGQGLERAHRLWKMFAPITVYAIICERSIDRKLEAIMQEKGDACELVLDGRLIGEQSEEVNLAELLEIAKKEFEEGGQLLTVDEKKLEKEWPPLRLQLSVAAKIGRLKGLELLGAAPPPSACPNSKPPRCRLVPPKPKEKANSISPPLMCLRRSSTSKAKTSPCSPACRCSNSHEFSWIYSLFA